MTPESIRKAATALSIGINSVHEAQMEGAALGRALVAEVRGRDVASQKINGAVAINMEIELVTLAASKDEIVAEIAAAALQALRKERHEPGDYP